VPVSLLRFSPLAWNAGKNRSILLDLRNDPGLLDLGISAGAAEFPAQLVEKERLGEFFALFRVTRLRFHPRVELMR
jgi:hypothetical protein